MIEAASCEKDFEPLLDDKSPAEQGNIVHKWLEEEFGDLPGIEFTQNVSWEDPEGEEHYGEYDAYDGHYIYEFKTKYPRYLRQDNLLPRKDDLAQIRGYLRAVDADKGVLVYIGRDELNTEEYLVRL